MKDWKVNNSTLTEMPQSRPGDIALRCRAKTMEIMTYFLFAMVAGCMIGYGITKDTAFLWLLIGAGIPFGVLQIVSIVLGLYYERNQ